VAGGQRQDPAALPPGKERQVSIVEEAAWATLSVWKRMEERNFLIPTVVQSPDCPIHSESLYRLCYAGLLIYALPLR